MPSIHLPAAISGSSRCAYLYKNAFYIEQPILQGVGILWYLKIIRPNVSALYSHDCQLTAKVFHLIILIALKNWNIHFNRKIRCGHFANAAGTR